MNTCLVVDLDNTLAIHKEGRDPRNHETAEQDEMNYKVIRLILDKCYDFRVLIFLTKRSTKYQIESFKFLNNINEFYGMSIILMMRDDSDDSDSPTFKKKKLEYIMNHYEIDCCVEDDDRNIKMMKELGLKVIDVKEL